MGYCYYLWTVYGNIYSVLLEKANRHKKNERMFILPRSCTLCVTRCRGEALGSLITLI